MKRMFIAISAVMISTSVIAQSSNWNFQEIVDPMSDAQRGIANTSESLDAMIVVKCDRNGPGSLYVSIISKNFLGKGRYGNRGIEYRFDGGSVKSVNAFHDGRTASIFRVKPGEAGGNFLSELSNAKEMVIRVTSYDYDTYTSVLPVAGSGPMIERVARTCKDTEWVEI